MNNYLIGACAVIGLVLLMVIIKAIKKHHEEKYFEDDIAGHLSRAREMGISLNNVNFDDSFSLLDPDTGKPIQY